MAGFAKDGNLYPTSGVYGIDDTKTSEATGWSSAKIEDRISKINIKHALKVDALPTCADNGDGTYTINYVKDGSSYTTTNVEQWFYYMDGTSLKQTIFIDGEETTIDGTGIVLDDYAEKVTVGELTDLATTDQSSIVNAINELTVNFQAGVDTLYDTCVDCGETPVDKTPTAIAAAIRLLAVSSNWWATWLSLGEIDVSNYSSLDDILADTTALDVLMKKHASVDYLINELSNNTEALDIIVNDENAMTYIGTYDYCSDMMLANSTLSVALLSSTYWQCILKDHVPTMTSDTTPQGTVTTSGITPGYGYLSYGAFDKTITEKNNGNASGCWYASTMADSWVAYQFTTPIIVKKVGIVPFIANNTICATTVCNIEASNDGSTWTPLISNLTLQKGGLSEMIYYDISNNNTPYIHYRFYTVSTSSGYAGGVCELDFFGRSLNVSVPTMTSNTTPEGECFASSEILGYGTAYKAWYAFNKTNSDASDAWHSADQSSYPLELGYMFTKNVCVKRFEITTRNGTTTNAPLEFSIQGSLDGVDYDVIENYTSSVTSSNVKTIYDCSNNKAYMYYKISITSTTASSITATIGELNFYGVDYSE